MRPRTQKMPLSIASLYITKSSVHRSSAQRVVPTGESFQIGCKRAANEEAEGENLLGDKCGIGHFTASDALATKRAPAIDRIDE
jgi:hypothetical protein